MYSHIIKIIVLLNFLIFIKFSISVDISLKQLKTCKEYQVNASIYKNFFKIENLEQNNRSENELIRLNFYTMTLMDAHILLSESDTPQLEDKVYDIVLGAGQNTYSTIRSKLNSNGVTRVDGNINFDQCFPIPIQISQTIGGKLTVFIFNKEYMSYIDDNPLMINFVSFKSYGGILAKWFYDCKFDGHEHDIIMEEKGLSDMERLEQNLFAEYDSYSKPVNLKKINFIPKIVGTFFDTTKSIVHTRVSIIMNWKDDRLKWNSSLNGDINIITGTEYNIWMPIITVFNAAGKTHKGFSLRGLKQKIFENGRVEIESKNSEIFTWCVENCLSWPCNNLTCEIQIGEANEYIHLFNENISNFQITPINQFSSWTFINSLKSTKKLKKTDLIIQLFFQKNRNFYMYLYYPPMLISIVFILMSMFMMSPLRGLLNILAFMIVILSVLSLAMHCPKNFVPEFVNAFLSISLISIFTYLLHILILWMTHFPPHVPPCEVILRIIHSKIIRCLLGMTIKNPEYIYVHCNPWEQLAYIVNRFSFIIVLICFSYILFKI